MQGSARSPPHSNRLPAGEGLPPGRALRQTSTCQNIGKLDWIMFFNRVR
jgi:hypothetical protein